MIKEKLFTLKITEKGPVTERPYGNETLYRGYIKTDHPRFPNIFLNVPMSEKKLGHYKAWSIGEEITVLVRKKEEGGKTYYDIMGLQ